MELYRRKLVLLGILLAVYIGISFWVPYSKYWLIKDVMQTQARLYFATNNPRNVRETLMRKAELLEIRIDEQDILVRNINGEIVLLEMDFDIPYDILFYKSTLHFEPQIFGLIRGFERGMNQVFEPGDELSEDLESFLSDSTRSLLGDRRLDDYIRSFFSR